MNNFIYPRLVIGGANSGAGKTSVCAALMACLCARGLEVQPFKTGPDYIDPAFHSFVTGRNSRNLDTWLLEPSALIHLFLRHAPQYLQSQPAGLSVVEGVMGLFDGVGSSGAGSTAELAQLLQAPVLLVINAKGMSRSIAALAEGYRDFQPGLNLAGVILNRISGQRHYKLLKTALEDDTGIPCLGYLQENKEFILASRHLGLVPAAEVPDLHARVEALQHSAANTLDLHSILSIANAAPSLQPAGTSQLQEVSAFSLGQQHKPACKAKNTLSARRSNKHSVRIGVAQDAAFSFYYQDNLDLLQELGAELVPFSPINDLCLPSSLHGLYLGGGFPEVYAGRLAANSALRHSIAEKLEQGLPAYAECGGMLYLCSGLRIPDDNKKNMAATDIEVEIMEQAGTETVDYEMTGFFPHLALMTKKLQHFGYVELNFLQDGLFAPAGSIIRAHEFHHSVLLEPDAAGAMGCFKPSAPNGHGHPCAGVVNRSTEVLYPVFKAVKPGRSEQDGGIWFGGLRKKNVLAAFPHIHFYSQPNFAVKFMELCEHMAEAGM